jgi:methionyl-tRNA formyltransferase
VACGKDAILVSVLQIPNKKAMTSKELFNGYSRYFSSGQTFMKDDAKKN